MSPIGPVPIGAASVLLESFRAVMGSADSDAACHHLSRLPAVQANCRARETFDVYVHGSVLGTICAVRLKTTPRAAD